MSRIDKVIAGDFAALKENSRRELPALDDALTTTNAYRDDRPGAEARRDALAEERRRELVLMPLTLAHVFAHRVGRAAAGAAAAVCAAVLILMLADPLVMRVAGYFVPGLNVGMCITLAALAILAAYVVASWIAEAWFARRMRATIKTGDDAYRDLDELARGPLEIAHAAVRRVDGLSTGLVLAGFSALTLAFGYVVVVVGLQHTLSNAWSISGIPDVGTLSRNLDILVVVLLGVGGLSAVVGRGCARDGAAGGALARLLAGPGALGIAVVIGVITLYQGFHMMAAFDARHVLPSQPLRFALALGAAVAVFVPAAWTLLWWRRREHARTEGSDTTSQRR